MPATVVTEPSRVNISSPTESDPKDRGPLGVLTELSSGCALASIKLYRWGSKIAAGIGFDVASWSFWSAPARAQALQASVFSDITSVMDFGIVVGALAAAGLAGKFSPSWKVPLRSLVAAVIGGVLMGYGARLAYGCNIGAYFSGIASASLHGWVWFATALVGSYVGTRLRPLFGLAVERSKLTGC